MESVLRYLVPHHWRVLSKRQTQHILRRWRFWTAADAPDIAWQQIIATVLADPRLSNPALRSIWKKVVEIWIMQFKVGGWILGVVFAPQLMLQRLFLAFLLQIALLSLYQLYKLGANALGWLAVRPADNLRRKMHEATTYEEWAQYARELDELVGNEAWKRESKSKYYNADLIRRKTEYCRKLVENRDIEGVMWHLRKGLLRRQGGVGHKGLYSKCYLGTKYVVEEYIAEICDALNFVLEYEQPALGEKEGEGEKAGNEGRPVPLSDSDNEDNLFDSQERTNPQPDSPGFTFLEQPRRGSYLSTRMDTSTNQRAQHLHYRKDDGSPTITLHQKLCFYNETRHSLGRSALLLSGGITLGMYHLGVLKTLYEQRLLPRVISGSSAGSIIAALFACKTEEEIPQLFMPGKLDLNFFERIEEKSKQRGLMGSSFIRRAKRLITTGTLLDINVLKVTIQANIGDMTFREAYERTGIILNISVTPSGQNEYPTILNYLTAPHVLIWSACLASCAIPLVFESVTLMAKDRDGNIEPYYPEGLKWQDGSLEFDMPMTRLSELFNVNHFIVSQVNPHVIPFSTIGWEKNLITRFLHFIKDDLTQYCASVVELGILGWPLTTVLGLLTQKYQGDTSGITIQPLRTGPTTFNGLMSNPTHQRILDATLEGERNTWPYVSILRNHCDIECALNECAQEIECRIIAQQQQRIGGRKIEKEPEQIAEVVEREEGISPRRATMRRARTRSFPSPSTPFFGTPVFSADQAHSPPLSSGPAVEVCFDIHATT